MTQEKKVLINFLRQETERLTNAINNAQENGGSGRIEVQEQMRNAFLKFLNNLNGETM